MCCTLDFVSLVLILLVLMAKYKSAMVYQYQSGSISDIMMMARSPLLTASAKKMLRICVGPIQSHWHSGNVNVTPRQTGSLGMTGENQAGGKPKRPTLEVTTGTN